MSCSNAQLYRFTMCEHFSSGDDEPVPKKQGVATPSPPHTPVTNAGKLSK